MKKYEAPKLIIEEIKIEDVVSTTFTENGEDGTTDWLNDWNSGLNKNKSL